MIEEVKKHLKKVNDFETENLSDLELFRIEYLGKKGVLNKFFTSFRNVSIDDKKEFGKELNILKNAVTEKIKQDL